MDKLASHRCPRFGFPCDVHRMSREDVAFAFSEVILGGFTVDEIEEVESGARAAMLPATDVPKMDDDPATLTMRAWTKPRPPLFQEPGEPPR